MKIYSLSRSTTGTPSSDENKLKKLDAVTRLNLPVSSINLIVYDRNKVAVSVTSNPLA